MFQYRRSTTIQIEDKSGNTVSVKPFRNRLRYNANLLFPLVISGGNYNRPDTWAIDNLGEFKGIGAIIDSNEKDVFDFSVGETVYYPPQGVAIV